jgi:predicted MFS family arabinose efflux permease
VIGCIGGLLSMFYRVSVAIISPELAHDFSLSPEQMGHISSFFFYAFALSQIPNGIFLDVFGSRIVMITINLIAVIGAFIFSSSDSFFVVLIGRVLLGIGMSCNFMGVLKLIASWFPAKMFATLSGVFLCVSTLGSIFAATPLAYLSNSIGWRLSFVIIAMINVLFIVLLLSFVRNNPTSAEKNKNKLKSVLSGFGSLIKSWPYWAISFASFFRYGSFVAIQGLWAAPFLLYGLKIDKLTVADALLLMGIGYMISMPLFGRISDHTLKSRKLVIIPSLLVMSLLIWILSCLSPNVNVYIIFSLFFMLGMAAAPGQIMFSHIKELVPSDVIGTAMTGVNLFTMLGAAILTQILGFFIGNAQEYMLRAVDFNMGFYFCSLGLIISSFFYALVPDR